MTDFAKLLTEFQRIYDTYRGLSDTDMSDAACSAQYESDRLSRLITTSMYDAIDAGHRLRIVVNSSRALDVGVLGMCTMPGYILRYGTGDSKWITGGISLRRITAIEIVEKDKKALSKTITIPLSTKERMPQPGDLIHHNWIGEKEDYFVLDPWVLESNEEIRLITKGSQVICYHYASVMMEYSHYVARVDGGPVTVEMQIAEEPEPEVLTPC